MVRHSIRWVFLLGAVGVVSLAGWSARAEPDDCCRATCKGADLCRACKSCKSCAHCKAGGKCGVCKPTTKPAL